MEELIIETVPYSADNYCYLIHHPPSRMTALVDCGDAEAVVRHLDRLGWRLNIILLAHHHYDHTAGTAHLIRSLPDVTVYKPEGEERINIPAVTVSDGEQIAFGPMTIEAIRLPAHTRCCTSYYIEGHLFVSDTLFSAGCGRLFEGQAADLERAMDRLGNLPSETLVYFGHEYTVANLDFALTVEPKNRDIIEYQKQCLAMRGKNRYTTPTTIAQELRVNPFLRIDHSDVITFVDPEGLYNRTKRIGLLRRAKDQY
ncbi:MAG: hydroxyacylglutathione hydrolase [Deltaproteobacteria bacterium]|nr:hydroxyacylglutathione hydrolase [Deltaproteobacteria bacterium]